jgi:hypothetical protein
MIQKKRKSSLLQKSVFSLFLIDWCELAVDDDAQNDAADLI